MEPDDEEQTLEMEALEAIFENDFERLKEETSFRQVGLTVFPVSGEEAKSENHVGVYLRFTLPTEYPSVVPRIEVEATKGLLDNHCDLLRNMANAEAEANIGSPMIFGIAELVKDWLLENNRDLTDQSMHAKMLAKQADEEREKEKMDTDLNQTDDGFNGDPSADISSLSKSKGTPVTKENLTEWLAKFAAEKAKERIELENSQKAIINAKSQSAKDANLTGRQYFEIRAANASAGIEDGAEGEEFDVEIQEDLYLDDDIEYFTSSESESD